jgi:PAS domain-containing protein
MNLDLALPALLTACAVGYLLLGARQLTRSGERVSAAPAILFFVIAIWVQGGAIELRADSVPAVMLARTAHIIGAAALPLLLFLCFREYIGKELTAGRIRLLAIVPLASVIAAASNRWHQLVWRAAPGDATGGLTPAPVWAGDFGPWFLYVHQPYSYVLIVAALVTLILHSTAVAPAHRRGIFLLFGATLAPLIVIVARDFGLTPQGLPAVPAVFAVLLPIYAWLFIREQITEFTPLAYATVFQNMQDPVIVVDDRRRIIGMNHGAELMLKRREHDTLRATLESVFGTDATEVYQALDTGLPQNS